MHFGLAFKTNGNQKIFWKYFSKNIQNYFVKDKANEPNYVYSSWLNFYFQTLLLTFSDSDYPPVNITGGPLLYTYRFTEVIIHWGSKDKPGDKLS